MSQRLLDRVALNLLPLTPRSVRALLDRHGDPGEVAFRLPASELERTVGVGPKTARAIVTARRRLIARAERELRRAASGGIRVLVPGSAEYPETLTTIADPPPVLYCRGDLGSNVARVAVVGSRNATLYGRRVAAGLASGLVSRGIEVVSGGARGIDHAAHVGALEQEGRTVAVLGSGLARPYPAEHDELFARISRRGALLSEFPLDRPPRPESFPRRNRLISGLAAAVVVVEAAERSGSLVTAHHALEQGRDVLAVPGPVTSERSLGCHRLIQDGAALVQNVDDVAAHLPPGFGEPRATPTECRRPKESSGPATEDEATVLGELDPVVALHLDDLAERVSFGIARLQTALFGLELTGAVDALPGQWYRRRE